MKNLILSHPTLSFSALFNSFDRTDLKKITAILFLGLFSFSVNSQVTDLPIFKEELKRGVYKTFEEFINNNPIFTDSFYTESKERKRKNWRGTNSLTPRFGKNGKKIKNAWGFCDGTTVYIFHQKEYFPIEINENSLVFYGYKNKKRSSNVGVDIIMVSASLATSDPYTLILAAPVILVGGIVAAATASNYKKRKFEYSINPTSGRIDQIGKVTSKP